MESINSTLVRLLEKESLAMRSTKLFLEFFKSEKSGGLILLVITTLSLILANSSWNHHFTDWFHHKLGGMSLEHWVNDGLMTLFFLLVGLELERELYVGELSSWRNAALPVIAAIGGMLIPAAIHFAWNAGTPTQRGAGIPMATDIAFSLGVLSLFGKRIPYSLRVFLTALAIADDLGAILVIAVAYTKHLSIGYLLASAGVFVALCILNRCKVYSIVPYLLGGLLLWWLLLHSGIHATLAGVLLAFAIPFHRDPVSCPSAHLQHQLHYPVAWIILPVFAFFNTFISLEGNWFSELLSPNSVGVYLGLVVGKPLGILVFCGIAIALGAGRLPENSTWMQVGSIGCLAGIGFTMSIFVSLLAYEDPGLINMSRISVLFASATSAVVGASLLWIATKRQGSPLNDVDSAPALSTH